MLGLGNSLVSSGAVMGWTPADISSLLYWYKFDTGQTIEDGFVTEWDSQATPNPLTASGDEETSPSALNGAVVFDHTGDIMTLGTPTELGVFSVYFRAAFDAFSAENCIETGSTNFFQIKTSSTVRVKIDNGGAEGGRHDYNLPATIAVDTKFNIGWERESDDTMNVYLNGAAGTQSGNGDGTQDIAELLVLSRLGKPTDTSNWYEVVICNDSLSSGDRALLNTYLNSI
jgi:hypothetical protein